MSVISYSRRRNAGTGRWPPGQAWERALRSRRGHRACTITSQITAAATEGNRLMTGKSGGGLAAIVSAFVLIAGLTGTQKAIAADTVLVPKIEGKWWQIS